MGFVIGKLLASLLLPPGLLLAGAAIALLLGALKKRRAALILGAATLVLSFLLCFRPTADALIAPLERRWPAFTEAGGARTLVVLGGGLVPASPDYGGHTGLSAVSTTRAAYAATLARRLGLPLVFTGGSPGRSGESEAEAARRFWENAGVAASSIRLETESRDTAENARFTAALLGPCPVILVTSAWNMPRAMLAFRQAGVEAIPAPTDYRASGAGWSWIDLLPDAFSLETSRLALHEWMGLVWYRVSRPADRP